MQEHDSGDPLITVVIPAFNADRFLREAIESALAQTIREIEVIVVDDGSTDATRAVAMDCARRDPRVTVLANAHPCWAAAARNRAVRAARSRYIALLDADDVWLPEFLATQMSAFKAFPDAMVVTGNARDLGGPYDGRPYRPIDSDRRRLPLLEMIEREDSVCIMSVFRREVFDTIGGFDEALQHNEDYDFWLRAAAAGCVFVLTPTPVGLYRRRPDSKSADESTALQGILRVLEKARTFCAGRPAQLAAINRQIARFEQRDLVVTGKMALRRGEFPAAAECFRRLYERRPSLRVALLARGSRYAPSLLYWLDRFRSRWMRKAVA
jgi:glycosyltransferase involved in cell wall biosynthesis